ncbi:8357_t:CDS:2, partial [Ambispora gerdemannii]
NYKEKNKDNYEDDESATAFFTHNIRITKIMYSPMPIEYPPTAPDGYAVVFNVDGWSHPDAVFKNIQYSLGEPSGISSAKSPFFDGIKVKITHKKCQEVKICEFCHSSLKNMIHTMVDTDSNQFKQIQNEILKDL